MKLGEPQVSLAATGWAATDKAEHLRGPAGCSRKPWREADKGPSFCWDDRLLAKQRSRLFRHPSESWDLSPPRATPIRVPAFAGTTRVFERAGLSYIAPVCLKLLDEHIFAPSAFETPAPAMVHPRSAARTTRWLDARASVPLLAALYTSGSVYAAAQAAGMTRETAYRLRRRPGADSFAAARDRILCRAGRSREPDRRKVTPELLVWRVETGILKPIVYRGALCGTTRKPDNTALLHATRRIGIEAPCGG